MKEPRSQEARVNLRVHVHEAPRIWRMGESAQGAYIYHLSTLEKTRKRKASMLGRSKTLRLGAQDPYDSGISFRQAKPRID